MAVIGGVSIRGASDSSRGKSTWNIILSTQYRSLGEISAIKWNEREIIFFTPFESLQLEMEWISFGGAKCRRLYEVLNTCIQFDQSAAKR